MTNIQYNDIIINTKLFSEVMGFNVMYIELVGRKNDKRIKFLRNYIKSETIKLEDFILKLNEHNIKMD